MYRWTIILPFVSTHSQQARHRYRKLQTRSIAVCDRRIYTKYVLLANWTTSQSSSALLCLCHGLLYKSFLGVENNYILIVK